MENAHLHYFPIIPIDLLIDMTWVTTMLKKASKRNYRDRL